MLRIAEIAERGSIRDCRRHPGPASRRASAATAGAGERTGKWRKPEPALGGRDCPLLCRATAVQVPVLKRPAKRSVKDAEAALFSPGDRSRRRLPDGENLALAPIDEILPAPMLPPEANPATPKGRPIETQDGSGHGAGSRRPIEEPGLVRSGGADRRQELIDPRPRSVSACSPESAPTRRGPGQRRRRSCWPLR